MAESAEKIEAEPAAKRDLIIAAARKLFLTAGFDVTSMDAIAGEAGVSKATVYSHFQNKESLFAEVMGDLCSQIGGPNLPEEPLVGPPEEVLRTLGQMILGRILDPEMLRLLRTVLAGSAQFPELGRTYWSGGPGRFKQNLSDYLAEMDRRGEVSAPDPGLAAMQFLGIVSGPYLLPQLLGVEPPPTNEDLDRSLDRAVSAFLQYLKLPR